MELTDLKFVSEKREKDFNKLNIFSVTDLAKHFPRDYLDLTHVSLLRDAYHNDTVLTLCEVLSVEVNRYARRPFVKAMCMQGGYTFAAIWFNQPYVATKLKRGEYLFYGRVQNKYGMGSSMVNPQFESADKNAYLKGLIPVYPLAGALTQGVVRAAMRQALSEVGVTSCIPPVLREKYSLIPLKDAYVKVHRPQSKKDCRQGAERIALEEYFLLISAFKVIKGGRDDARLNAYSVTRAQLDGFVSRFPFGFTAGQKPPWKKFSQIFIPRRK